MTENQTNLNADKNIPANKETVFLEWESDYRPFQRKSREFYTTAGSIIFLVCVILLFIKEFLAIFAVIALAFFYYVISSVPPEKTKHKISNRGIHTLGKLYPWFDLGDFWFDFKMGKELVIIEHFNDVPPRLVLVLEKINKVELKEVLKKYLDLRKPQASQIDKMADWLIKKVPLEETRPDSFAKTAKSPDK